MDKDFCKKGHLIDDSNKTKYKAYSGCKKCILEYSRKWRNANPEKVKLYRTKLVKKIPSREEIIEIRKKRVIYVQNWRKLHPEKADAYRIYRKAMRDGVLVKPKKCQKCKVLSDRIEGHHTDYFKPLKVIWLCTICHYKEPKSSKYKTI